MMSKEQVLQALEKVKDPELNMNVVDLGLIYDVSVGEDDKVVVEMTLTTPACPAGPAIMADARDAIVKAGAPDAEVNLVWEPRWTQDMMSERLKKLIRMGIMRF